MKVTMNGVRGSIPTPGKGTLEYGGNTTCYDVVSQTGDVYIFDAGSGIVNLGNDLMQRMKGRVKAKLFISHDHWDHIQGFPFFVPAYVPGCEIEVYSGDKSIIKTLAKQQEHSDTSLFKKNTLETIADANTSVLNIAPFSNHTKDIFRGQQDVERGYFPIGIENMGSRLTFHDLKKHEIVKNGLTVKHMFHNAHPGGMFSYKVQEGYNSIVFTGDYECDNADHDRKMVEWAYQANLLVIDAQYTPEEHAKKKGWGHSNIIRACELGSLAKVGCLMITHHDPSHNDEMLRKMELQAQEYMQNTLRSDIPVVLAKEGMSLEI